MLTIEKFGFTAAAFFCFSVDGCHRFTALRRNLAENCGLWKNVVKMRSSPWSSNWFFGFEKIMLNFKFSKLEIRLGLSLIRTIRYDSEDSSNSIYGKKSVFSINVK